MNICRGIVPLRSHYHATHCSLFDATSNAKVEEEETEDHIFNPVLPLSAVALQQQDQDHHNAPWLSTVPCGTFSEEMSAFCAKGIQVDDDSDLAQKMLLEQGLKVAELRLVKSQMDKFCATH